ncbi:universal stress protein [Aquimarina intermedia]|uniref:Nucleotide-binding universal stress UspA family protein n=1 Tax=Aquimarina intermedia TaxID=350814 RepID=A0A5S5C548_9FLAO|nr:universal stress protein [Aquimarina intermedia]TYP74259.1 nucleotide-binding universal stress UspA family protein [Aquimarina intermedia]
MKKIIVPTDFSDNALNALHYAVELFKYERCEFFIMHAYADEVYDNNSVISRELLDDYKASVLQTSENALAALLKKLAEISPNPRHTYKTLSRFGNLVDETNELVDEQNIDVVIMGTRGKTDDRKITFGSHTLQVLKYVKCPVLAIPSGYNYIRPKTILFPTDFRLPYKRRELKILHSLSKSYRSIIHCLYVSKFEKLAIRQEDNKAFLEEALSDNEIKFHTRDSDDLTTAINTCIDDYGAQMLVMINSRHSYLESILYQSTIDKIGLHLKVPFFVMQNLSR